MYDYLLISCVCILHIGFCAEECYQAVLARRETFHVPAGGSLSLSCGVQHCGDTWTGSWMWKNSTDDNFSIVKDSTRHHLIDVTISANETKLVLQILSVNQSDEGSYGCSVTWGNGDIDQGHLMYVNITSAVPPQRIFLHRVLVCAGAFLCLPIILGLACCLSSKVEPQPLPRAQLAYEAVYRHEPLPTPQPPPRCPVPPKHNICQKAPPRFQQKTEVVYADIAQDALRQQRATRGPAHSTVYSSLKFS